MSAGLRSRLADLVSTLHLGIAAYLALGWALPWCGALVAAVTAYPIVLCNWWAFGNRCVLTLLEEQLRGTSATPDGEPLHFVQQLGGRLLARPVSRAWADGVSYAVVCGGFAVAGARLVLSGD